MADAPLACTLTSDQQRCRAEELLPALCTRALSSAWVGESVRLTFAPTRENLDAIAHTISHERECCAFLGFRLDVPSAHGEFGLLVTGPEGTRGFLAGIGVKASAH